MTDHETEYQYPFTQEHLYWLLAWIAYIERVQEGLYREDTTAHTADLGEHRKRCDEKRVCIVSDN